MAEAREIPARSYLSNKRGDRGPSEFGRWFRANWSALFMLFFIFVLALFVRSYFGYQTATDGGYWVSGGSDSYYWERIIKYSSETGKQFYWDPMINYPEGIRNPRPPFFSMSIVVPAILTQDLFASMDDSIGMMLLWSTAFWGALTVVPTYFLGKETFGRRAGLVAAFLLALMPSHVQRSVLSEADHDSFILFFIVLTFYFILKAVKAQEHRRWVESWKSWESIRKGLGEYARNSRTAILYSLMAGVAFGSVIMAWVGFGYAAVLVLAYYVIQVLVNKFKNVDSLGVTIVVALSLGFGYLLSFPVYYEQNLIPVRFDVPVYLFLASLVFGMLFVVSRDYPWTLTFPAVAALLVVGVLGISIVSPELGDAILSGQGYFVKSKLYSTIAEARAPRFSELAMSFGVVTFFLSLIGLIWAIIKLPRRPTADIILIVVWLGAAIFMAISAGRFMFNAAPAFAIAAAWVLVIIVDKLDFGSVRKSLASASGSYWHVFKKSVKIRHVVGTLFLAFMIVLPNVWYAVDAGIPSETKREYDKQIYYSIPSFMRPGGYDKNNGSDWYLGAFGYSIPLPNYYFPAAWQWFSQRDSELAPAERPAYVSWWDYGFEAVQAGGHPTVADNFQNGYQLTGNILMAQNETEALALFAFRLVQTAIHQEGGATDEEVTALMEQYGISSARMHDIVIGPGKPLVDEVLSDPEVYGPMASDLSEFNARIVAARVELVKLGLERLVSFYSDLCDVTGWNIRYFNVDSRMFPRSGRDTGIFYAPAKLSDRRVARGSTPIDFYEIKAVDDRGIEHSFEDVTPDMTIVDYSIEYKDMFFDSMLYRAMAGYSGSDIGLANDGVPGLSGSVQKYMPMPGWNMTHFRMVYRTAYFNPYPLEELAHHRNDWRAVSLEEAKDLAKKIDAGEIQGYVDDSPQSYYGQGAVFLEYYEGAFVNGTLTTEQGYPVSGVRVTVSDEYGIPHQTTFTDAQGKYSLLAPFGNVTLTFSTGAVGNNPTLQGSNTIARIGFNVTDDQAMRKPYDADGDGILDYIITKDFVMKGTQFTADIFWDVDDDGNYTSGTDELIANTVVYANEVNSGQTFVLNATDGTIDTLLPPGQYNMSARVAGANILMFEKLNITAGAKSAQALPLSPASLRGNLAWPNGTPAADVELVLFDMQANYPRSAVTTSDGNFSFDRLLASKYLLASNETGTVIFNYQVSISQGADVQKNVTIYPGSTVRYRIVKDGSAVPFASFMISNVYDPSVSFASLVDQFGRLWFQVPVGTWTLYATSFDGTAHYAGVTTLEIESTDEVSGSLVLQPAVEVSGTLRNPKGFTQAGEYVTFESADGGRVSAKTNDAGQFNLVLPEGTYKVTGENVAAKGIYSGLVTVQGRSAAFLFRMVSAVKVSGTVWTEKDVQGALSAEDLGRLAHMKYTDMDGRTFTFMAAANGTFSAVFPKGEEVTLGIGEPGYSRWSPKATFSQDSAGVGFVAIPDDVLVTGKVEFSGVGMRDIQVAFMPDSVQLEPVYAHTVAGGYYSVLLPPSSYKVVVNQDTSPMGGEKYMYEAAQTFLPSAGSLTYNIRTEKKVEMFGTVLGAFSDIVLELSGPEERTVSLSAFNYSLYVVPGTYNLYVTGTSGTLHYANMSVVDVTALSRQYDIQLVRAYRLSGQINIGSSSANKIVTVTALSSTGDLVRAHSNVHGAYGLDLIPGPYEVSYLLEDTSAQGGQTLYVEYSDHKSIVIGASDVSADVSLTMRLDNTTFSGTVYGPDGSPKQAFVSLLVNGRYGQSASFLTAATGQFSVQVQPGDYTMYVTRVQDKRVSLSDVRLSRNAPLEQRIDLVDGKYLSGRVTAADVGIGISLTLTNGSKKLQTISDSNGEFSALVPSMDYTVSASTSRMENGMSISYSLSTKVSVKTADVYVDLPMLRDTKRGVAVSWNKNFTQTAAPGVKLAYVVTVTNTGNIQDTFTCSFSGSGFDVTFSPSQFTLGFGTNNRQIVVVEIVPGDKVAAGNTKVSCLVRSKVSGSTRADMNLYVNVAPSHSVRVYSLNESAPVSSRSTVASFELNNTGNVPDNFDLQVSNLPELAALGWTAEIVESANGTPVQNVSLPAFGTRTLYVRFTSTRANAGPSAEALVLAVPRNYTGAAAYGNVPVMLPDLVIGAGDIEVKRSDVSYEYDVSRLYIDLVLVVSLASLIVAFYVLRRKKGLSRGGRK
ncbi:MAG: STT3 domain-containing protein [Thermoplasmata archaeon]